ncbi:hypothetical protein [Prescottella equi]|uniref:hypothetical protein n=1 Tax=Rhodococcus hoagii TaxID=43767 RepID=UPI00111C6548|nr:hypothetical protein [Prescottella equi]
MTSTESPPGYDELDALIQLAGADDIHGTRELLAALSDSDFAAAVSATLEVRQHHAEVFQSILKLIALESGLRQARRGHA